MGFICNIYLMLQLAYFLISSDTSYTILFMSMSIEDFIMFKSMYFWFQIPGTQTCEEAREGKLLCLFGFRSIAPLLGTTTIRGKGF